MNSMPLLSLSALGPVAVQSGGRQTLCIKPCWAGVLRHNLLKLLTTVGMWRSAADALRSSHPPTSRRVGRFEARIRIGSTGKSRTIGSVTNEGRSRRFVGKASRRPRERQERSQRPEPSHPLVQTRKGRVPEGSLSLPSGGVAQMTRHAHACSNSSMP